VTVPRTLSTLSTVVASDERCVWVIVADAKGSTPRDVGASMIVTKDETFDTIGGGHLELKAIEFAREQLASNATVATTRHFPLGPALGQCCGGHVTLLFAPIGATQREQIRALSEQSERGESVTFTTTLDNSETLSIALPRNDWHIAVFGAGHVGKAIVNVLSELPCDITWIDEREAEFPKHVASNVTIVNSDSPASEVAKLPPHSQVLVLTHSHALDLDICFALLKRDDLAYCGLIGSATKAATFRKRFEQRGYSGAAISRIMCPIGQAVGRHALKSKHPGVIAASVAFDLSERRLEQQSSSPNLIGRSVKK
jgi:xanthine dehydrogenase accessory factor